MRPPTIAIVALLIASTAVAQSRNHIVRQRGGGPGSGSTIELIDAAMRSGRIDRETGFTYKVFAVFGDCRLPEEFRGAGTPEGFGGEGVAASLRKSIENFSPATRDLLQPFLLAPSEPGSWARLDTNCANQSLASPAAREIRPAEYTPIETKNGKAVVWYRKDDVEEAPRAQRIADTVDAFWTLLTKFFGREPLRDDHASFGSSGDGRLDIFVRAMSTQSGGSITGADTSLRGFSHRDGCSAAPAYIVINSNRPNDADDDRVRLVHYLTHAILAASPGDKCGDYRWLDEATATWAEQAIYPELFRRTGAAEFLRDPRVPLETIESDELTHAAGAYLFLFYIAQGLNDAGLIYQFWENSAQPDSLANIDSVLSPVGGLKEVWPDFVAYNWNREPIDDYHRWDPLPTPFSLGATESRGPQHTTDGKSDESIGDGTPLPHLSAAYYRFVLSPSRSSVLVLNGWTYRASKETAAAEQTEAYTTKSLDAPSDTIHVDTLVKINGSWQKLRQDWTNEPYKIFCRDWHEERVDEIVVIVSNSEFRNRESKFTPPALPLVVFESNIACGGFTGDVHSETVPFAADTKGVKFRYENHTLIRSLASDNSIAILGVELPGNNPVMELTASPLNITGCKVAETHANVPNAALHLYTFAPIGSGAYRRAYPVGMPQPIPMATLVCPDGVPGLQQPYALWAFYTETPKVSADGKQVAVSITGNEGGSSINWKFVALPPD